MILPPRVLGNPGVKWIASGFGNVVVQQRAVKTRVKIAESGGNTALVESGVAEGDEVVLFSGEKIRDDVKVH